MEGSTLPLFLGANPEYLLNEGANEWTKTFIGGRVAEFSRGQGQSRGMGNTVVPGVSQQALDPWMVAQRGTKPILQLWLEPTLVVTLTKAKRWLQLINKSNYIPEDRRCGKDHGEIVLVRCYTRSTLNGSNHRNGIKTQNSCQRFSQGRAALGAIRLLGAGYYNSWQTCDLIQKRFPAPPRPLSGTWMVLIVSWNDFTS